MAKIIFRELPGIASIERRCSIFDKLMADEREDLLADLDVASLRLFGIKQIDTAWNCVPASHAPASRDDWDLHFDFLLEWEYDEEGAFWDAVGVDVTNGKGEPLNCLAWLGRQLVCAIKGLHPVATFSALTGEKSDAQVEAEARAWGERLLGKKDRSRSR